MYTRATKVHSKTVGITINKFISTCCKGRLKNQYNICTHPVVSKGRPIMYVMNIMPYVHVQKLIIRASSSSPPAPRVARVTILGKKTRPQGSGAL